MTRIKINLKGGFKTVQEGERVLEITEAKVTPSGAPNKLVLIMKDVEDGANLQNTYNFNNDTSVWAMGMMLNIALGLEDGDDFDTNNVSQLVGIKLRCEIAHAVYNDKTYANVKKVIERVYDNTEEMTSEKIGEILYSRNDLDDDLD